jgi:arylsulfatase A-like enzyme
LFTGEPPTTHGAVDWGKKIQENTLVKRLNELGYRTHTISPHIVSGEFNIEQQFQTSEWIRKPGQDPPFEEDPALEKVRDERRAGELSTTTDKAKSLVSHMFRERSWQTIPNGMFYLRREIARRRGHWKDEGGSNVIERAKSFVRESDQPFFLFANFVEPHAPYRPPKEYVDMFVDDSVSLDEMNRAINKEFISATAGEEDITELEREILQSLHDAELRYLDDKIRDFYKYLEEKDIANESLIAIFSDHGDLWGEDGIWGHQAQIHENLCHVPLILSYPWQTTENLSEIVQLSDLHDHFLSVADGNQTELSGGEALIEYYGWDTQLSIEPWTEYVNVSKSKSQAYQCSLVRDDYRLYWDATGEIKLFDITGNPAQDIASSHPDVVERLQQAVEEKVGLPMENHKQYRQTEADVKMDNEALEEHLSDLGYF